MHYDFPGFRTPDLVWQIATCINNKIPYFQSVKYLFNPSIKEENLRNFDPNVVEPINAGGNCYFSALSFMIPGSKCYHKQHRALIVDKMLTVLMVD